MTNPFGNLPIEPLQSSTNHENGDNSSESSQDSEMDEDDDYGSESSNSSQDEEDQESDEEESEEEEDEEELESQEEQASSRPPLSPRLVEAFNRSPLNVLKKRNKQVKKLPLKQVQLIQEEQQKQQHEQRRQQLQQQEQLQLSISTADATTQQNKQNKRDKSPVKSETEAVVLLADQSAEVKRANFSVRTLWTLIMIGGFFACVAAGPLFVILLVVLVQGFVYKEVIYLANVPSREKKLSWFRTMNWYFLFSTNYFFYGESLIHYFQHVVFVDAFLLPFATHHRFISFTLYVIASLVVANDIWAYIFGFFFGKTPLIKLSPKKTVEGFVGGWVMTIFFGMLFATLFLQFPYMICPVKDLRATAFSGLTCEPNPVFIPMKHNLTPWMASLAHHLGRRNNYVMIAPLQWHVIIMACFASLIAPFGGFFASGFKRAFKIKDFGQSIPGHGGITDRMDCQFLMGLFSYMYYQSFIATSALSVGSVLQTAINNLNGPEQMELFDHMRHYLIGQGLLDDESCVIMPPKEAWIS
ncbi:hypothetical protein BG004_001282 [Podila humilis]|nr:hypothetical protein BG004_001282 [Podila humilis]